MKISNSKKQLAKIISENGSWPRNADWAAQCKSDSTVSFYYGMAPYIEKGDDAWYGDYLGAEHDIDVGKVLPNWHQTILSRDEYFHLYPAPDAELTAMCSDVTEENKHPEYCESVMRSIPEPSDKPTIEQLAAEYRNRQDYAERKQQEADAAKAEAEAKLAELVAAGKALGLVLSVAASEPELVITDIDDLIEGDVIELTAGERYNKTECTMVHIDGVGLRAKSASDTRNKWWNLDGHQESEWRFIRRPTKEATNA